MTLRRIRFIVQQEAVIGEKDCNDGYNHVNIVDRDDVIKAFTSWLLDIPFGESKGDKLTIIDLGECDADGIVSESDAQQCIIPRES